jgi:hypothetical protein
MKGLNGLIDGANFGGNSVYITWLIFTFQHESEEGIPHLFLKKYVSR